MMPRNLEMYTNIKIKVVNISVVMSLMAPFFQLS